jgi:hypothetical protein
MVFCVVSEDFAASVFSLKMEAAMSSETYRITKQRRSPEDHNLN